MLYEAQIRQVLATVLRAGSGQILKLKVPAKADPLSGITTQPAQIYEAPFATVTYNREDIADPSLANGLTKVLISPVTKEMNPIPDFVNIVENKGTVAILPTGEEFKILHTKTTRPDGVTPIITRAFLGG